MDQSSLIHIMNKDIRWRQRFTNAAFRNHIDQFGKSFYP